MTNQQPGAEARRLIYLAIDPTDAEWSAQETAYAADGDSDFLRELATELRKRAAMGPAPVTPLLKRAPLPEHQTERTDDPAEAPHTLRLR